MADGQATLSSLVLQGRKKWNVYTRNVIYQPVVIKDEMLLSKKSNNDFTGQTITKKSQKR